MDALAKGGEEGDDAFDGESRWLNGMGTGTRGGLVGFVMLSI